ncbi:MAG: hypothetical protein ABSC04_01000 [Syntrophobacteraceae bacterium]
MLSSKQADGERIGLLSDLGLKDWMKKSPIGLTIFYNPESKVGHFTHSASQC